ELLSSLLEKFSWNSSEIVRRPGDQRQPIPSSFSKGSSTGLAGIRTAPELGQPRSTQVPKFLTPAGTTALAMCSKVREREAGGCERKARVEHLRSTRAHRGVSR